MIIYMLLAFLNGMFIGTSRAINGRLNTKIGPFKASLWNHIVGFVFLTLILSVTAGWAFDGGAVAPLPSYLGGFFGALFVAVNSYVFPKLGAMKAILLVIGGQMTFAVLLDYLNHDTPPTAIRWLGVMIVLWGVYASRTATAPRERAKARD